MQICACHKALYGESEWDGPFSLKDMLEIPEKIEPLVSDYRMNLVQVRSSGELCFSDPDVNMVFDMSRLIYARDYAKIKEVYSDHDIPADLGVVIGAITESQKLINHSLTLTPRPSHPRVRPTAVPRLPRC